jgi:hypothetical protein
MSGTKVFRSDQLQQLGANSGRSWANSTTPRRLFLFANYVKPCKVFDPVEAARQAYPDLADHAAVSRLWGTWPPGVAFDSDDATLFIQSFCEAAMQIWCVLYDRFSVAPRRSAVPEPAIAFEPEPVEPAPKPGRKARPATPIKSINLTSGEITRYPSVAAAIAAGFSKTNIYSCLSGAAEHHRGCAWHRDDQPEAATT